MTVLQPDSRSDAVLVRGIEFEANHGYTDEEQRSTRRFKVSLVLRASLRAASQSDHIRDTIDYRKVCEIVVSIGTQQTFRLLEALAGAIGAAIQATYPGVEVIIELDKLAPPCPGVPESCGVRLYLAAAALGA